MFEAGAGGAGGSAVGDGVDGESRSKTIVNVEACLKPHSTAPIEEVRGEVVGMLESRGAAFCLGPIDFSATVLSAHLSSLKVSDLGGSHAEVPFWQSDLRVFVYQLNEEGVSEETMDGEDSLPACSQWVLPAREFDGVWESLYFDTEVKNGLLEFTRTAMLFADKRVDSNIVACNRVVLLHGPPGTGKTSLCKALAHKLAIRLSDRYPVGQLLEINAHSLFSKWFSESGKLVMKLFEHITELVEDSESLVCVLIDEVESLTAARKSALAGSEPSDAVRVVNALLTQLDALRSRENVLILTTSNITDAIDIAFVDRADIKQFIGLPSHKARYEILRSCVFELMRVGIVVPSVCCVLVTSHRPLWLTEALPLCACCRLIFLPSMKPLPKLSPVLHRQCC